MIRRIIEIVGPRGRNARFHLHWLKVLGVGRRYGSKDAQEVFLEDARCDTVSVQHIIDKVDFQLVAGSPAEAVWRNASFAR